MAFLMESGKSNVTGIRFVQYMRKMAEDEIDIDKIYWRLFAKCY